VSDEKTPKMNTCALAAKAEWEGLDYLLTDVDPNSVENEELADWIRVGRVAWQQVREWLDTVSDGCDDEDCEICAVFEDEDEDEDEDEGLDELQDGKLQDGEFEEINGDDEQACEDCGEDFYECTCNLPEECEDCGQDLEDCSCPVNDEDDGA
jgi:hypothetical protein